MRYHPLNYEQLNMTASTLLPNDLEVQSYSFAYWERALFQRACYSLIIEEDEILKGDVRDFFYYVLFRNGFVTFYEDKEFGKIFQPCSLYGFNVYYQPTECMVANPRINIGSKRLTIGSECELIKLTPDFIGVWDIIEYYASKLAALDPAVDISIVNSKVPFIMHGKTKGAVSTLKKIIDQIIEGKKAIFFDDRAIPDLKDGTSPIDMLDRPHLANSYITDKLLEDRHKLLTEFDNEIGIPIPVEKKERLITGESEQKRFESQARITIWKECLDTTFNVVNERYGTNFRVKTRMEVEEDGREGDINRDVPVSSEPSNE